VRFGLVPCSLIKSKSIFLFTRYVCKCEHIVDDGYAFLDFIPTTTKFWTVCSNLWKTISDVFWVVGTIVLWLLSIALTILPTATVYAELVNYVAGPYISCSGGLPGLGYVEPYKFVFSYAGISFGIWIVLKYFCCCPESGEKVRRHSGHTPHDPCGLSISNIRNTVCTLLAFGFVLLSQALALDRISESPALRIIYDVFSVSVAGFFVLNLVPFLFSKGTQRVITAVGQTWYLFSFYTLVLVWKIKGDVTNNVSDSDPSKCSAADFGAAIQTEFSVNCTFVSNLTDTGLGCPVPFFTIFGWTILPYSEQAWKILMWASFAALALHPPLVEARNNLLHGFYANSLVAAFYHEPFNCGRCCRKMDKLKNDATTTYVGGMVINQWQDTHDQSYGPLTADNFDDAAPAAGAAAPAAGAAAPAAGAAAPAAYPRERSDINHMQWGVFEYPRASDNFDDVADDFLIDNAMGASGAAGKLIVPFVTTRGIRTSCRHKVVSHSYELPMSYHTRSRFCSLLECVELKKHCGATQLSSAPIADKKYRLFSSQASRSVR
jgi:hypothetical protein